MCWLGFLTGVSPRAHTRETSCPFDWSTPPPVSLSPFSAGIRKVVVIDGVGYPAVGSICGVSNAEVAATLDAPVLLVGKSGVGDAVDSFNLNSCFFEARGVRVLGGVFNRLSTQGFYSLEKCKEVGFVFVVVALPSGPCAFLRRRKGGSLPKQSSLAQLAATIAGDAWETKLSSEGRGGRRVGCSGPPSAREKPHRAHVWGGAVGALRWRSCPSRCCAFSAARPDWAAGEHTGPLASNA